MVLLREYRRDICHFLKVEVLPNRLTNSPSAVSNSHRACCPAFSLFCERTSGFAAARAAW